MFTVFHKVTEKLYLGSNLLPKMLLYNFKKHMANSEQRVSDLFHVPDERYQILYYTARSPKTLKISFIFNAFVPPIFHDYAILLNS